jgi:hypothetical protein
MNKTNKGNLSQVNIIDNEMLNDLYKFKLRDNAKNPACKWKDKKN